VVIFENCKPILGEKIRYYRDKAFTSRLLKAPAVPRMDMDLHLARVQQRWRYADDELPAGQTLNLEALAHDTRRLLAGFLRRRARTRLPTSCWPSSTMARRAYLASADPSSPSPTKTASC
jgi:hypothetical protein